MPCRPSRFPSLLLAVATLAASGCASDLDTSGVVAVDGDATVDLRSAEQLAADASAAGVDPGRYCEVVLASGGLGGATIELWTTQGLNTCPADSWDALDAETLALDTGARRVVLNGPRVALAALEDTEDVSPLRRDVGGVELRLQRSVDVEPLELLGAGIDGSGYRPVVVPSDARLSWPAGTEVHELRSPEGEVFVMQSLSQVLDPGLTVEQLADLEPRLALPDGWSYGSLSLAEELVVEADGQLVVVSDDLGNGYVLR